MDGRPKRENKAAFSNFPCVAWTGPQFTYQYGVITRRRKISTKKTNTEKEKVMPLKHVRRQGYKL